ncbi:MAG: PQQ-dependent dehydrogenase, methanol/ethanol family, partial [Deltaproteobacteria bacterium]|nr:PQQ-dependent dehydrogenase, methanol/ethanol family [Deltaproteobacteria bacterium]
MSFSRLSTALLASLLLQACGGEEAAAPSAGESTATPVAVPVATTGAQAVDDRRLEHAPAERTNWLTHGRTYSEQRFSPLDSINAGNVDGLIQTWGFSTGMKRGHEATPIVVDGVMYLTSSWSVV